MNPVTLEIPEASMIRVHGPMRVRVLSGTVMVLGAIFRSGDEFEVRRYRSYAVKALTDSRLSLVMEAGALIEPVGAGEEVIDSWVYHADKLIGNGCRGFIVIGPVDAGKSSYAALLANRSLLRGLRPGVVDADIGQADIGPPGFVSAAIIEQPILWLREARARYMRFVGSITPQRSERRIVAAAVELGLRLRGDGAEVIVVDTDGWVQGLQALDYKSDIARMLSLDAAVAIGLDPDTLSLADKLFSWLPCGLTVLGTPRVRRTRGRDERRELRAEAYRRYLEPGHPVTVRLDSTPVQGSCIQLSREAPPHIRAAVAEISKSVVDVREYGDAILVVTREGLSSDELSRIAELTGKQVIVVDGSEARGLLVSLVTGEGREVPALVEGIDVEKQVLRLRAAEEVENVRTVIVGGIRLREDYTESRPSRCPL